MNLSRSSIFPRPAVDDPLVTCQPRRLSRRRIWRFRKHEDVTFILQSHELFTNQRPESNWLERVYDDLTRLSHFGPSLIDLDPPHHTRLRRIVSGAFSPAKMRSLEPYVRDVVDDVIAGLAKRERVDMVADFAAPVPMRIISRIMGCTEAPLEILGSVSRAVNEPGRALRNFLDLRRLARFLRRAYAAATPGDGDGVIAIVKQSEREGSLTRTEALDLISLLMLAGYVTTIAFLSTAVLVFLVHADERHRAQRPGGLTADEVEELLRFASVLNAAHSRFAKRDVRIGDAEVRRGDMVIAELTRGNLDAAVFADPERLDFDRRTNPSVAFGHGIHFCLGAPLVRLEARIALHALFTRFPQMHLASGLEGVDVFENHPTFAAIAKLPVDLR